jgi:glyceraldehyde 3-phosphate dehydrogenase
LSQGSLVDDEALIQVLQVTKTTAEEVNHLFATAAAGPLAGILGYEERPLVSADYARDTRSSIVDALSTMVTDGTMLKVYAWYDNEMAYACRMVDLACHMQAQGI